MKTFRREIVTTFIQPHLDRANNAAFRVLKFAHGLALPTRAKMSPEKVVSVTFHICTQKVYIEILRGND